MEKDLTTYVKDFILKYSDDINNKNSDALLQALTERPYLVYIQANTTIVKLCLSFGIPMDENLEVKSEGFELRINLYDLIDLMDGHTLKMDYSIKELIYYIVDPYSSLKVEEFFTDEDLDEVMQIEYSQLSYNSQAYLAQLGVSEEQFNTLTNLNPDVLSVLRDTKHDILADVMELSLRKQAILALEKACPPEVSSAINLQREELVLTGTFEQFATSYKLGDKLTSYDVAYNAAPFALDYTHCLIDYLARRLDFDFDASSLKLDEKTSNDEFEKALLRLI